jgi:hypothetical protein
VKRLEKHAESVDKKVQKPYKPPSHKSSQYQIISIQHKTIKNTINQQNKSTINVDLPSYVGVTGGQDKTFLVVFSESKISGDVRCFKHCLEIKKQKRIATVSEQRISVCTFSNNKEKTC